MRPLVFLDFDGVLITYRAMRTRRPGEPDSKVDREAVAALNFLIEQTGAAVVISSTWRMGRTDEELQTLLTRWGARCEVIGATPRLSQEKDFGGALGKIAVGVPRGVEISRWLLDHPEQAGPIVIVDDERDVKPLLHRLIHCRFEDGLTMDLARKAVEMLRPQKGATIVRSR